MHVFVQSAERRRTVHRRRVARVASRTQAVIAPCLLVDASRHGGPTFREQQYHPRLTLRLG